MVSTAGGIVIAIIILALAGALAWVIFTQLRARKLGPSNIGGLRGVSPRPIDTGAATQQQGQQGPKGGSPTERRSMFRENV
ncbi:hypothetical protein VdG1_01802 [Verticillium dahliae VDG1]|nr:hypothetical protein VdG1_01802 [Verticillium dahliae VDG1]